MMKAVVFLLSLIFIFSCSQADSILPLPQLHTSFQVNSTQNDRSCSYTVKIKTSCSSTRYTRDHISLAFGDAYDNQVYAPGLDDPHSRAFERCSTDTYTIRGPCTHQICYLYVYRSGYDGWMPDSVTVTGYYTKTVKYYFKVWVPNGVWYGFNHCRGFSSSISTM